MRGSLIKINTTGKEFYLMVSLTMVLGPKASGRATAHRYGPMGKSIGADGLTICLMGKGNSSSLTKFPNMQRIKQSMNFWENFKITYVTVTEK